MSEESPQGAQTEMRLYEGEKWPVLADLAHNLDDEPVRRDTATLRRVGWLDQKGRVWTRTPSSLTFDGGSLTPLLIDAREDGH